MMAASRTRPGNPDRGWNDPPMFNFTPQAPIASAPRRLLNQRVAYPVTGTAQPGHAVLAPGEGPPCLNPVLAGTIQQAPPPPPPIPIPIGLRDTPLGNQAAPISPIQLLPPSIDTATPQTVPILVPILVPSIETNALGNQSETQCSVKQEQLDELLSRLHLNTDKELIETNMKTFDAVLDKYKHILTMKASEEIRKKLDLFQDRWKKGAISDTVKVIISQLAEALLTEETDKAYHLHLALMVDHISEVNQWMMGIKRLLQQQQLAVKEKELILAGKEDELAIDQQKDVNMAGNESQTGNGDTLEVKEDTLQPGDKDTLCTLQSEESNSAIDKQNDSANNSATELKEEPQ